MPAPRGWSRPSYEHMVALIGTRLESYKSPRAAIGGHGCKATFRASVSAGFTPSGRSWDDVRGLHYRSRTRCGEVWFHHLIPVPLALVSRSRANQDSMPVVTPGARTQQHPGSTRAPYMRQSSSAGWVEAGRQIGRLPAARVQRGGGLGLPQPTVTAAADSSESQRGFRGGSRPV